MRKERTAQHVSGVSLNYSYELIPGIGDETGMS